MAGGANADAGVGTGGMATKLAAARSPPPPAAPP